MIHFGGDHNPEQWPEKVWAADVELMRQARVTLVTVGVFAWSRLQPGPDEFDFGWLDRVLDQLGDAGIGVCLATPTASPPPWFTRRHPDAMPVTRDGVRLVHGSRDTYCVNAPAYREASSRITRELAARYADHAAVRLWHIHNEYGTACFCEHCAVAFRSWLSERYGDVSALNEAWSTDFWSQRYGDLDEVLPPRATQYLGNPAHLLDYRRFVSDAMLRHYSDQRSILRVSAAPVTTNFVLGHWVPVDHARWAREVDVVAVDDYPATVDDHLAHRAFAADRARGWARAAGHEDGRWMLMEHAPGAVHDHRAGVVRPLPAGEARAAALTYLERGATAVMYFQWRASRGGSEQWHPAMVPHEGPASPIFAELSALGAELAEREPVTVTATTALVYDEQTMWAWQAPHLPTRDIDYEAVCRRWHRALGGVIDVVPPFAALSRYRLVVVPLLYLMPAAVHAALREYVRGGGTLVLTFACGLVDECCRATPGALDDLIGARVVRHVPLLPTETVALPGDTAGRRWLDELEPAGAAVLLRTADGLPAVTEHRYGAGVVRYVATDLDDPLSAVPPEEPRAHPPSVP